MANRQEQKAQRKAAREEAARAEAARAKRARLLQFGVGGLLVVAILAGLIVLTTTSGGDGASDGPIADDESEEIADVQLPPQQFEELEAAVEASGCVLEEAEDLGGEHVTENVPLSTYNTNPPTSGPHQPPPAAEDGVYPPGSTPEYEAWLHTLEHGRIVFQYQPGTSEEQIDTLRALTQEPVLGAPGGYHTAVMQNNTDMPYPFVALNWTRVLGCQELSPATIDAMRLFREEFTDDAPERVP